MALPVASGSRRCVTEIMTKFDDLTCGKDGQSLKECNDLMEGSRKGKLPIINDSNEIVYGNRHHF